MVVKKSIRVVLVFPETMIKKPLIYIVAKKFNLVPNIFSAKVTETTGKVELELEGKLTDLKQAIRYLERKGIQNSYKCKKSFSMVWSTEGSKQYYH
jgi:ABC-type methionine transport system ATPase subunit